MSEKKKLFYPGANDTPEMSYEDRCHGMLVVSPQVTDANRKWMMPMVAQDIRDPEMGMVVVDNGSGLARIAALMAQKAGRPRILFDPTLPESVALDVLGGEENDVITAITRARRVVTKDAPQYFQDLERLVLEKSIKVVKRLDKAYPDRGYATLEYLRIIIANPNEGKGLIARFSKIPYSTANEAKEGSDIVCWFMNEYYSEQSNIFESCIGLRNWPEQLKARLSVWKKLSPEVGAEVLTLTDLDKCLSEGGIVCISLPRSKLCLESLFLIQVCLEKYYSVLRDRLDDEAKSALYLSVKGGYLSDDFPIMLKELNRRKVAVTINCISPKVLGYGLTDRAVYMDRITALCENWAIFGGISAEDDTKFAAAFVGSDAFPTESSFRHRSFGSVAFWGVNDMGYALPVQVFPEDVGAALVEEALES